MNKTGLKCYLPFAENEIKKNLSYKSSFFLMMVSRFLSVLVTIYLWRAIYSSSPNTILGGFVESEMLSFVSVVFLVETMTKSVSIMDVAQDISEGKIAYSLLLPISYQGVYLGRSVGKLIVNTITVVLPFFVIFTGLKLIVISGLIEVVLFFLSSILGFLILYYFSFMFVMVSFHTTYFFGINLAKDAILRLLSGSLIPLSFLPAALSRVLSFLPFSSMTYYPVMIFLGKYELTQVWKYFLVQLFWLAVFYLLCQIVWKRIAKYINVLGG